MTLAQFITKWNGKKADYDGRYGGECVDLYNFYMRDVFGLNPWKHGAVNGAKDLAKNLPKYTELKWVKNDPFNANQLPPKGAIIVFNGPIGGGYGHVGIVIEATASKLIIFDQIGAEDPRLEAPARKRNQTALWGYVLGWAIKGGDMYKGKSAEHWWKRTQYFKRWKDTWKERATSSRKALTEASKKITTLTQKLEDRPTKAEMLALQGELEKITADLKQANEEAKNARQTFINKISNAVKEALSWILSK